MGDGPQMSHEEASRVVKKAAADQQIDIVLTEEQMKALLKQWSVDPHMPALVRFRVADRPDIELAMASYSYSGDTCCALREFARDSADTK
jgi:iron only hydrogenase large subunit-like protein